MDELRLKGEWNSSGCSDSCWRGAVCHNNATVWVPRFNGNASFRCIAIGGFTGGVSGLLRGSCSGQVKKLLAYSPFLCYNPVFNSLNKIKSLQHQ